MTARRAPRRVVAAPTAEEAARTQWLVIQEFPRPETARALSPNGSHGHWAAKDRARKAVRELVAGVIKQSGLVPVDGFAVLRPRFVYPDRRKRDDDNLATGVMKVVRDTLVRAGILVADDADHVRQEPAEPVVEKGSRRFELAIVSEPPVGGWISRAEAERIVFSMMSPPDEPATPTRAPGEG